MLGKLINMRFARHEERISTLEVELARLRVELLRFMNIKEIKEEKKK